MKLSSAVFVLAFVLPRSAFAAEPDRTSPYDKNPKCTERTTDGSDPDCVLPSEGTPRQVYPPGKAPSIAPPPVPKPPGPPVGR